VRNQRAVVSAKDRSAGLRPPGSPRVVAGLWTWAVAHTRIISIPDFPPPNHDILETVFVSLGIRAVVLVPSVSWLNLLFQCMPRRP
jgi:hypothetical protein